VFAVQKIRFYVNTGIDRYVGNDNCSVVVLTLNLHVYDDYAKRSNRDNAITMGYCVGNATNRATFPLLEQRIHLPSSGQVYRSPASTRSLQSSLSRLSLQSSSSPLRSQSAINHQRRQSSLAGIL
jgi:hypothetical protein